MAATIAFDATQKSGATVTAGNTYTMAMTVAAASGAERLVMLAALADTASGDYVSVTIDGVSATRVGSKAVGVFTDPAFVTAYRAAGTANTSINVVMQVTGSTVYLAYCACYKLAGVGTLLASNSANALASSYTLSVNTSAGGAAVAAVYGYDTSPPHTSTWTGLTEDYDSVSVGGLDVFTGASLNTGSASTPLAITEATSTVFSTSMAALSLSFDPAAAAGGVTKQMANYSRRRRV
jgi:ABC-type Fe3+-siderophore transport system permease subunit